MPIVHTKWIVLAALLTVGGLLMACAPPAPAEDKKADDGYAEGKKVDPVEANERIFVDWPKPTAALVFTGEQDGYLEPCGCAGLENQKGGLRRRMTLFNELRGEGWPIVPMDLGGQEKRTGVQADIKFDFALRALIELGYAAVGLGDKDLRMDLLSRVINLDEATNPLVSANVGIVDFDSGFTKRFKVVTAGGMKIGITSVLGKKAAEDFKDSTDLLLIDPERALAEVLPKLRAAKCDQLVLLAYADAAEAKELARKYPDFNWVVAHGADEPPNTPTKIAGANAQLIEVGQKGKYAVVVGLYKTGPKKSRYQKVPLVARFADAPEIDAMHVEYQQRLEDLGLEGLGLKAAAHASGDKFAGSKVCGDCHATAYDKFINTPHSHATDTLVKLKPPRHFDPECLSCHVTGWEPQKYFPFATGYLGLKETPELVGNGCENCHGPAARHVAAENGKFEADEEELENLRVALRLKMVPNEGNKEGQVYDKGKVVQMCMQCHDLDNSPEFDFQKYWPKVEHVGKD
jgi:hypothetical protein